jgi:hypothetical protein
LRIIAFGSTAVAFLVVLIMVGHRTAVAREAAIQKLMTDLTPERVIALCGPPESDDRSYINGIDVHLGTYQIPASRELMYKKQSAEGWAKLEFLPQFGSGVEVKSWRLQFFSSPTLGTSPKSADSCFIPDGLPCLRGGILKP